MLRGNERLQGAERGDLRDQVVESLLIGRHVLLRLDRPLQGAQNGHRRRRLLEERLGEGPRRVGAGVVSLEAASGLRENLRREPREALEVLGREGRGDSHDVGVLPRDRGGDGAERAEDGREWHWDGAGNEGRRQAQEGGHALQVGDEKGDKVRVEPGIGIGRDRPVGPLGGEDEAEELHEVDLVKSSAKDGRRH